jgi:hypothetical protein
MGARKLEIIIPPKIWEQLENIERKKGIRKEDILMRAVVKVIEEFGG